MKAIKFIIRQGISITAIAIGVYLIFHVDPAIDKYRFYAALLGTSGFAILVIIAFYLHFFVKKKDN